MSEWQRPQKHPIPWHEWVFGLALYVGIVGMYVSAVLGAEWAVFGFAVLFTPGAMYAIVNAPS